MAEVSNTRVRRPGRAAELDDLDALKVEHDENEQRKEPTVSEKVALAEAIAERLQGRQLANLKQNREGNISHSDDTGRTKDIAATKVGLGCGKTLEAALPMKSSPFTSTACCR